MLDRIKAKLRTVIGKSDARVPPSWLEYASRLEKDLIDPSPNLSVSEQKRLFKKNVQMVEIEPHAFCNRTCSFCPNSLYDRVKIKDKFDAAVFDRVLGELKEIDYDQAVRFARYSEPLAQKEIFEMVRKTREVLPGAFIDIVSNGDYATPDKVELLRQNGLNALRFSVYLKAGQKWTPENAEDAFSVLFKRAGLDYQLTTRTDKSLGTEFKWKGMTISAYSHNFDEVGFDRGQALAHLIPTDYSRQAPCTMVFTHFTVDYDGTVMPCCNLRGDVPEQKQFEVGNLKSGASIFEIYAGKAMASWRKNLYFVGDKLAPCNTCKQKDLESPAVLANLKKQIRI